MALAVDWIQVTKGQDPMVYLNDVFRYALARVRCREDAEDIAIEVVQSLPNPCRRRDLKLYMIGMARRKVADRFRSRIHDPLPEHLAVASFEKSSVEAADVERALSMLNEDYREVLLLKYVVGLTSREVGVLLGKRSDAVDSMLQRARDAFADHYLVGQSLSEECHERT